MGAAIFKVFVAVMATAIAIHWWRMAEKWKADGVIPGEWNEGSGEPVKVGGFGFRSAIVWQKLMAIGLVCFALLASGSLLFDLVRML